MGRERFRDSDPVEEILRIAMRNQGGADASLRQRLLASATELGISEEAALAAQEQWEKQTREKALHDEYGTQIKREFQVHLGVYVVVNLILVIINRMTTSYPWAIWPILGLGIGMGVHAVVTWVQLRNPGGQEFERWRRRHERRETKEQATDHRFPGAGIHVHPLPTASSGPKTPSDNT